MLIIFDKYLFFCINISRQILYNFYGEIYCEEGVNKYLIIKMRVCVLYLICE